MGIRKAFIPAQYYGDKDAAEFENMADIKGMIKEYPDTTGLYVSKAIHKTHIELMEKGTKASAVTYFEISRASGALPVIREKEYIDIEFNKPFIYLIREKNTGEMLFFGVVNEPNLWNGSTCSDPKEKDNAKEEQKEQKQSDVDINRVQEEARKKAEESRKHIPR